jgi:predicted dehydrogenase
MPVHHVSRRSFLQSVAGAAVAAPFLSRGIRAAQTVRHASIGSSGQAFSDIMSFAEHPAFDLVAVADVDLCKVDQVLVKFPKVRVYQDWRELLKKERDHIDSVSVSTPDHMHCMVAVEALRRNKPVYVQKPLCNTLHEVRLLTDLARERGLTTQMGIQVSSSKDQRYGEALVRSGIVGKIKEVHTFSNKSWGDDQPLVDRVDAVPPTLDWDQWLGVAETRPFKRGVYHPGEWRKRVGFGTGTLGDMGCHIYSPPYRALGLTSPIGVMASGPAPGAENWAKRQVKPTYGRAPATLRTSGGATAGRCRRLDPRAGGHARARAGEHRHRYRRDYRPAAHQRAGVRAAGRQGREPAHDRSGRARSLRGVPRGGAGGRQDAVLGRLRLRGPSHRVGAHRQRRRAFPGRDARIRRKGAALHEQAGSESVPDADLPEGVDDPGLRGARFARTGAHSLRSCGWPS